MTRLALAAAAFIAFAAPTPAATDPFGGLPATYRVRELITTTIRIAVPGPDLYNHGHDRGRERMVFSDDGTVTIGSRRRPDASFSGTWTETQPGQVTLVADAAYLTRIATKLERQIRKGTGTSNWHIVASSPDTTFTIDPGGQTGIGTITVNLSGEKRRISMQGSVVATCKLTRIE